MAMLNGASSVTAANNFPQLTFRERTTRHCTRREGGTIAFLYRWPANQTSHSPPLFDHSSWPGNERRPPHNMKRAIAILGVGPLLQAIRARVSASAQSPPRPDHGGRHRRPPQTMAPICAPTEVWAIFNCSAANPKPPVSITETKTCNSRIVKFTKRRRLPELTLSNRTRNGLGKDVLAG
jgi:hypothetical protein